MEMARGSESDQGVLIKGGSPLVDDELCRSRLRMASFWQSVLTDRD
jgi:hypothetical protein